MAARYLITITDPKQRKFYEELIGHLDLAKVKEPSSKAKRKWTKKEKEFMEGMRESIQEMKDDLSGKEKLKSARAFLDELRPQRS